MAWFKKSFSIEKEVHDAAWGAIVDACHTLKQATTHDAAPPPERWHKTKTPEGLKEASFSKVEVWAILLPSLPVEVCA